MAEPTETSAEQIVRVYRRLAERHANRFQSVDASRLWRRIRQRRRAAARPPQRVWALAGAFAVTLSVAVVFAVNRWYDPALSYELEGVTLQQDLIRADREPGHVRFSDGSHVGLERNTALALSVVGNRGALARLTRGKLHVRVTHSRDTDWRFLAGPYEVRVVGTAFDLGWDAAASRMTLVMHEGRVRVVGPEATVRTLSAGQSIVLGPEPEAAKAPSATVASASEPEPPASEPEPPASEPEPRGTMAAAGAAAVGPSWAKLVAKGRFDEVVQTADAQGIDHVLGKNSAADLKALAHAAHYTGRMALALRCWTTLRQRFADTATGRQSAFFVGRIHDQQGRPAEALSWFDRYLAEARDDVYASEALGRKLTLVRRLSGITAAQKVAREYVARFPSGSYVQAARDLLTQ